VTLYDQPEIIADAQLAQARFGSTNIAALRTIINYRGGQGFARGWPKARRACRSAWPSTAS
jgi:translocation and assembly module TamB